MLQIEDIKTKETAKKLLFLFENKSASEAINETFPICLYFGSNVKDDLKTQEKKTAVANRFTDGENADAPLKKFNFLEEAIISILGDVEDNSDLLTLNLPSETFKEVPASLIYNKKTDVCIRAVISYFYDDENPDCEFLIQYEYIN